MFGFRKRPEVWEGNSEADNARRKARRYRRWTLICFLCLLALIAFSWFVARNPETRVPHACIRYCDHGR